MPQKLSRRAFVHRSAAAAALAAMPFGRVAAQVRFSSYPFKLGVAYEFLSDGWNFIDRGTVNLSVDHLVIDYEEFRDISAGASDDISRATDLARAMVTELGMSERIGPINYAERQGSDFLGTELMSAKWHSEETAREIDCAVREMTDKAREKALQILRTYREQLERGAKLLLEKETLHEDELAQFIPVRKQPKAIA